MTVSKARSDKDVQTHLHCVVQLLGMPALWTVLQNRGLLRLGWRFSLSFRSLRALRMPRLSPRVLFAVRGGLAVQLLVCAHTRVPTRA